MRLHRGGGTNRDSDRIGGETGRRAIALVSIRTRRAVARRRRSPQYLPTRAGNARSLRRRPPQDRKSTRLNSSHMSISYAVFCLKKKKRQYLARIVKKKKTYYKRH